MCQFKKKENGLVDAQVIEVPRLPSAPHTSLRFGFVDEVEKNKEVTTEVLTLEGIIRNLGIKCNRSRFSLWTLSKC